MSRVLASAVTGVFAAVAAAGCGASTTTVRDTVVTIVKTTAAPAAAADAPASQGTKVPTRAAPTVRLPNVVGQRLDVAEMHLDDAYIRYREVGGGAFGIVVRSNWVVCEQEPAAGATNPGRVALIVDRAC